MSVSPFMYVCLYVVFIFIFLVFRLLLLVECYSHIYYIQWIPYLLWIISLWHIYWSFSFSDLIKHVSTLYFSIFFFRLCKQLEQYFILIFHNTCLQMKTKIPIQRYDCLIACFHITSKRIFTQVFLSFIYILYSIHTN